jgi:PKD repeat protein
VTVRTNRPPLGVLNLLPTTGNAPLATMADASSSADSDGTIVSYRFDFGDGTVMANATAPVQSHTYVAGSYTARLTVTDNHGATHSVTTPVIVAAVTPGVNIATNYSAETGLTGWAATPTTGTSLTRQPGGFDGAYAIGSIGTANTSSFGVNDSPNWVAQTPSTLVGHPYRFSAWVRSPHNTGLARLTIREFQGVTKLATTNSQNVRLTPVWQLVSVDHLVQQAGTTLDFQVLDFPVAPSETLYVDNVTIKPVAATTGVDPFEGRMDLAAMLTPNPLHTGGEIHFTLPHAGFARIEVLDLSGRRVRTLLDAHDLAPGARSVAFDGRSADGLRIPSGVYFYRVQTRDGTLTHRFAILR